MNAKEYGITDLDALFENVFILKLKTGEILTSYIQPVQNGMMLFLPMELSKEEDEVNLQPYFPFVQHRFFYIDYEDMLFAKSNPHEYIKDAYVEMCSIVHKDEISDILFSWNEEDEDMTDAQVVPESTISIPEGTILH